MSPLSRTRRVRGGKKEKEKNSNYLTSVLAQRRRRWPKCLVCEGKIMSEDLKLIMSWLGLTIKIARFLVCFSVLIDFGFMVVTCHYKNIYMWVDVITHMHLSLFVSVFFFLFLLFVAVWHVNGTSYICAILAPVFTQKTHTWCKHLVIIWILSLDFN